MTTPLHNARPLSLPKQSAEVDYAFAELSTACFPANSPERVVRKNKVAVAGNPTTAAPTVLRDAENQGKVAAGCPAENR